MKHYGLEPPWRGFSRHYGEWRKGPELFEGGYVWDWLPPDRPGSFMGQFARALESYKAEIKRSLNQQAYGSFTALSRLYGG